MTCDEALDLLEPHVDGDLTPAETDRLRAHLEACPACAAELMLAQRIQRELRALPQLDCPPEVVERARRQGAEVVPFRSHRAGLPLRLAAAAAALVLAVGGAFFVQSQRPRQPSATEIAQANQEARFALAYIGRISRRTGLDLRDDVIARRLVRPATRSVSLSLGAVPEQP